MAAVEEQMVTLTVEMIVEAVKQLDGDDFATVVTTVAKEMERRSKGRGKSSSAAKGVIPAQFQENYDWVDFVMQVALEHGWAAFEMHTSKKDGTEEIIEMGDSVLNEDGVHQFSSGQKFTRKHAMVLSAKLKREEDRLYSQFKASYVPRAARDADDVSSASPSKVVRMTAEDKEAEKAQKLADKEAEKERVKAEKEAEKERVKAQKEAEKERIKAEKEAEKERIKAEKEAAKAAAKAPAPVKVTVKVPIAVKVVPKPAIVVAAKPAVAAPKAAVAVKQVAKPVAEEWSCPAGSAKKWMWKGEAYVRDDEDLVWKFVNGDRGDWCGKYIKGEDRIDETVEEPQD